MTATKMIMMTMTTTTTNEISPLDNCLLKLLLTEILMTMMSRPMYVDNLSIPKMNLTLGMWITNLFFIFHAL